jgi:hypothetical protein
MQNNVFIGFSFGSSVSGDVPEYESMLVHVIAGDGVYVGQLDVPSNEYARALHTVEILRGILIARVTYSYTLNDDGNWRSCVRDVRMVKQLPVACSVEFNY